VAAFMQRFAAEQKAKRRKASAAGNQRKRERELAATKLRASTAQNPLTDRMPTKGTTRPGAGMVSSRLAEGTFLLGRNGATSKWA
jgi:hypothetical protein